MLNNPIILGGGSLPTLTNPGTAGDLLTGKQLIDQNGNVLTGTMANRGAVSQSLNAGGSYAIPQGYHNGNGRVTANSLSSQTSGTATAEDIASGKTAWVNGTKITGTAAGGNVGFKEGRLVTQNNKIQRLSDKQISLTISETGYDANTGTYPTIDLNNIIAIELGNTAEQSDVRSTSQENWCFFSAFSILPFYPCYCISGSFIGWGGTGIQYFNGTTFTDNQKNVTAILTQSISGRTLTFTLKADTSGSIPTYFNNFSGVSSSAFIWLGT